MLLIEKGIICPHSPGANQEHNADQSGDKAMIENSNARSIWESSSPGVTIQINKSITKDVKVRLKQRLALSQRWNPWLFNLLI